MLSGTSRPKPFISNMIDENLIATLEQSLRQTRNAQNRLMARLREVEDESRHLRQEIEALENSAAQTEKAMDSLLVTMRSGNRGLNLGRSLTIEDVDDQFNEPRRPVRTVSPARNVNSYRSSGSVSYINHSGHSRIPTITSDTEPISHRFSDRTIT